MKRLILVVLVTMCLCGLCGCRRSPVTVPVTAQERESNAAYQEVFKQYSALERSHINLWISEKESHGGVPAGVPVYKALDEGRNLYWDRYARNHPDSIYSKGTPEHPAWEVCGRDLGCLYKEYVVKAHGACMGRINERQTADMKGAGGLTFEWHEWASKREDDRRFKMGGDQLLMQNEHGAYIRYRYSCTYNPKNNTARLDYFRPF